MFFCPGTAREALLWREPCNSVVGRHRSHSVWTADASWFSTSDTPTGSRQEGQVMHVGVVPSAQPQNCWLQRAVLSGSPPAELTDVYFLRVLPIRRTTTAFLWTFTWILILWGVPWDLHKIKKPSYYYFFCTCVEVDFFNVWCMYYKPHCDLLCIGILSGNGYFYK